MNSDTGGHADSRRWAREDKIYADKSVTTSRLPKQKKKIGRHTGKKTIMQ